MQRVLVQDAQSELAHLLEAAVNGETILIIGADEQAVQLVPVTSIRRPRKAGSAQGMVTFSTDFDASVFD